MPDTSQHLTKDEKRDDSDLAIAGLGAAPLELAAVPTSDFAHAPFGLRSPSVSSVTQPPVRAPPLLPQWITSGDFPWDVPGPAAFFKRARGIGPKVPDLRGLTLRAVLEESAATGLPIEVQGDGMARAQDPPPGAILAPGSRVHVQSRGDGLIKE